MAFLFCSPADSNHLNAIVRWTIARPRLDRDDTSRISQREIRQRVRSGSPEGSQKAPWEAISGSTGNVAIIYKIRSDSHVERKVETAFQYLQLENRMQIRYNASCLREANTEKEVGKMFFFSCGNCCNNDCSSIWQILSQICGFGC